MAGWDDERWIAFEKHMAPIRAIFGAEKRKAVPVFEDAQYYDHDGIAKLILLQREIEGNTPIEEVPAKTAQFAALRDSLVPSVPEKDFARIYLWEGEVPTITEYGPDEYRHNHGPEFKPYMYEFLLPEDVTPKGAVVVCAGGDHGDAAVLEGLQICRDMNAMGYQAFHLLNRPNHSPWSQTEAGADMARAVRMVRADAAKYRIPEDHIAVAGFSNGGVTCEGCIQFFSGDQKMTDYFKDYTPDALDEVSADPNAFLCVYGPRFAGESFKWDGVVYPPVFYAVGREDGAMNNLNATLPDLLAHGVAVETHTFAGVPHGQAGVKFLDGKIPYPNFETWEQLADAFLRDLFR